MNKLQYKAAILKIDNMKTLKELEAYIREAVKDHIPLYIREDSREKLIEEYVPSLKLRSYALKVFKNRSKKVLPDFIETIILKEASYLLCGAVTHKLLSYDEYIDTFQYVGKFSWSRPYGENNSLINFIELIGDKEDPYDFTLIWNVPSIYSNACIVRPYSEVTRRYYFKTLETIYPTSTVVKRMIQKEGVKALSDETVKGISTNLEVVEELARSIRLVQKEIEEEQDAV